MSQSIDKILEAAEKATPGPWKLCEVGDKCKHLCPATQDDMSILTVALEYADDDEDPEYFGAVWKPEDARLIAGAPQLAAEVRRLREREKALEEALERLARLGNGDHYGNSDGNMIARAALAFDKPPIA